MHIEKGFQPVSEYISGYQAETNDPLLLDPVSRAERLFD